MVRHSIALLAVVSLANCALIPSTVHCPDATEVEKAYGVTATCGGGGVAHIHLRNLVVNHRNDCPSGCFSTATADVEDLGGGVAVSGQYSSYCGSDPGELRLHLALDGGGNADCFVELSHLGEAVTCDLPPGAGACTVRLTAE